MSAQGNPYDNAKAESCCKTLKRAEVSLSQYEPCSDAEGQIGRFIDDVYHQKRLHSSVGYRPPSEYESLYNRPDELPSDVVWCIPKAVSVARVSTEDQGHGWSLPTQLQAHREYAERSGLEIIAEFEDTVTGMTLDRTGLSQALEILYRGDAQALIVYTPDRLSRKFIDLLMIREDLQRRGIEIHIAKHGRVMGDSAETRALDNVAGIFTELEREMILDRAERGRRGKIESGRYLGNGHPPFGYRIEGEGKTTQLVIDEEQAEIVHLIFQLFAYGDDTGKLAASAIARRLSIQGIPTPADVKKGCEKTKKRGYAEWDAHSIYPLLRNSVYVGRFTNGRFTRHNKKLHRNHKGTTTITVPAIVDQATWDAVQQRLDRGKAQSPRRTKHEYLIARRLKCVCGYNLIGRPSVSA